MHTPSIELLTTSRHSNLSRVFGIRFAHRDVGIFRWIDRILYRRRRGFRWNSKGISSNGHTVHLHGIQMPNKAKRKPSPSHELYGVGETFRNRSIEC